MSHSYKEYLIIGNVIYHISHFLSYIYKRGFINGRTIIDKLFIKSFTRKE